MFMYGDGGGGGEGNNLHNRFWMWYETLAEAQIMTWGVHGFCSYCDFLFRNTHTHPSTIFTLFACNGLLTKVGDLCILASSSTIVVVEILLRSHPSQH